MSRSKKYYYGKKTKKRVIEEYFETSVTMSELSELHGILGSNTVADWIRKYGHLTKPKVHKVMTNKSTSSFEKKGRKKRQRNYEQIKISELEIDLDETRQRLNFYRCALSLINELATELCEIDLLKKTGNELSIRRAKRKL